MYVAGATAKATTEVDVARSTDRATCSVRPTRFHDCFLKVALHILLCYSSLPDLVLSYADDAMQSDATCNCTRMHCVVP